MKTLYSKIFSFTMAIFFIGISASCAQTYKLYNVKEEAYVPVESGFDQISRSEVVVLGETHYDPVIQQAEAWTLERLALRNNRFQLAWEFLDYRDQAALEISYQKFKANEITGSELINGWFSKSKANHELYLPLYEVAKKYDLEILGTNSPRKFKQKLMAQGRDLLDHDKEIWPFSTRVSDAPMGYRNRFSDAMGGHVDTQTLDKYYLAQFYTDAYMANAIDDKLNRGPIMMVVGHFHSDYGHGLPHYLFDLGIKEVSQVRLVNLSQIDDDELEEILKPHSSYGTIADYILLID